MGREICGFVLKNMFWVSRGGRLAALEVLAVLEILAVLGDGQYGGLLFLGTRDGRGATLGGYRMVVGALKGRRA